MRHLRDALCRACGMLGFNQATGSDEVFWQLVLARIIDPTSKQDSLRVLEPRNSHRPSPEGTFYVDAPECTPISRRIEANAA